MSHWPFPDPPDTPVITVEDVTRFGRPILFVEHLAPKVWVAFDSYSGASPDRMLTLTLAELLARDPSLADLGDIPVGWRAEREDAVSPWEKETRAGKEKTLARMRKRQEEMLRTMTPMRPGAQSSEDILREHRGSLDG